MYITAIPLYFVALRMVYQKTENTIFCKWLSRLGRYTLGIYMTNELVIHTFEHTELFPMSNELAVMGIAVGVTGVCFMITNILKKNTWTRRLMLGEQ